MGPAGGFGRPMPQPMRAAPADASARASADARPTPAAARRRRTGEAGRGRSCAAACRATLVRAIPRAIGAAGGRLAFARKAAEPGVAWPPRFRKTRPAPSCSSCCTMLPQALVEGPKALETAGLLDRVVTDPGLLAMIKMLPRKESPTTPQAADARQGGKTTAASACRRRRRHREGRRGAEETQAEQDWMDVSAKLVAGWCKRFETATAAKEQSDCVGQAGCRRERGQAAGRFRVGPRRESGCVASRRSCPTRRRPVSPRCGPTVWRSTTSAPKNRANRRRRSSTTKGRRTPGWPTFEPSKERPGSTVSRQARRRTGVGRSTC